MRNFVALISCVSKKQSKLSPAEELYTSLWFCKAKAYVEQQRLNWYILSAKHGLLNKDEIIQPYNQTLKDMPVKERKKWANQIVVQIQREIHSETTIQIFAGISYRKYLVPKLEDAGYIIEVPLINLGIGQQLAWFKSRLDS